jgi:hypothetical protein
MTPTQFHTNFKIELDKTNGLSTPSFEHNEIDYWLNMAIRKFVKTRYSGMNVKGEGFEQTQKRTDDLRLLVKEEEFKSPSDLLFYEPNKYTLSYSSNKWPDAYWFAVSESVDLKPNSKSVCMPEKVLNQSVIDRELSNYRQELANSLSDYHLHNGEAHPIRVWANDHVDLYTDGNYDISKYTLTYLKKPDEISYTNDVEYTDLPEHAHDEIIRLAVALAMGNILDPRYQFAASEISQME